MLHEEHCEGLRGEVDEEVAVKAEIEEVTVVVEGKDDPEDHPICQISFRWSP